MSLLAIAFLVASQTPFESFVDDSAIQSHLLATVDALRADEPAIEEGLLLERRRLLDALEQYALIGLFPHNHDTPGIVPVFIDEHGTHCAVAELLRVSGARDLAGDIARADVFVELPTTDPVLDAWAEEHGFRLDELALIQPGYPGEQSEIRRQNREVCELVRRGELAAVKNAIETAEVVHDPWKPEPAEGREHETRTRLRLQALECAWTGQNGDLVRFLGRPGEADKILTHATDARVIAAALGFGPTGPWLHGALIAALRRHDVASVDVLLGANAPMGGALSEAAMQGSRPLVQKLLRAGADPNGIRNCPHEQSFVPQTWPCSLIAGGKDPLWMIEATPLHWAASRGEPDIAADLVNKGATGCTKLPTFDRWQPPVSACDLARTREAPRLEKLICRCEQAPRKSGAL